MAIENLYNKIQAFKALPSYPGTANEGKANLEDDLVKNIDTNFRFTAKNNTVGNIIPKLYFGTLSSELITSNADTVTIDSAGSINVTRGALTYPWILFNNDKITEIEYAAVSGTDYILIAGDSDSVLAINIEAAANFAKVFRFTSAGSATITTITADISGGITSLDVYQKVEYVDNILNVYHKSSIGDDYVLGLTLDISEHDEPELYFNVSLGFVCKIDGDIAINVRYGSAVYEENDNKIKLYTGNVYNTFKLLSSESLKVLTDDLVTEDGCVISNDSKGTIVCDSTSRTNPFAFINSNDCIEFEYTGALGQYLILYGDTNSVIAIRFSGNNGWLFRFYNDGTSESVGFFINGFLPMVVGETIRVLRVLDKVIFYRDGVLEGVLDTLSLADESEISTPIFGFVITSTGTISNNTLISNDIFEIDYKQKDIVSYFKKWATIGDSISVGGTYQDNIINARVVELLNNISVSGSTITNTGADSMVLIYDTIDSDADLISIFGGTNDFGNDVTIGTSTDVVDTTFWGAYRIIIEGLLTSHGSAGLFLYTIPKRNYLSGGLINGNGDSVEDFNFVIRSLASEYSLPVVDLYNEWGVSALNMLDFTTDNLHPNEAGHLRISKLTNQVISKL